MAASNSHHDQARMLWLGLAWAVVLTTCGLFVHGHWGVTPNHLDPLTKHISQYASSAPHRQAIQGAMLGFSALTLLAGVRCVFADGAANRIAGIILAMSSALVPFVAVFRTWVVPLPVQAHESWKDKVWNRLFGPPGPPANPVSPLEAGIHDRMIGMATAGILLAVVIHLLGHRRSRGQGRGWGWSLLAAWIGSVAGLAGSRYDFVGLDGLWQRLGFACVIACQLLIIVRVCGGSAVGRGRRMRLG